MTGAPPVAEGPDDWCSLPGHDRDSARAIWRQAHHGRTPLSTVQVEHLLRIGFSAGRQDVAAQARRECADELMGVLRRPGTGYAHLGVLADYWSGSGRTPAGEEERK